MTKQKIDDSAASLLKFEIGKVFSNHNFKARAVFFDF